MYEVEEDESGALHWVVASSKNEAAQVVMDEDGLERNELSVGKMPDVSAFPVTFVDGFDTNDGGAEWMEKGFCVSENEHGHPVVTGTAAQWAALYHGPTRLSCSEW